ncbi:MAG TPA: hypothetical protein DD420_18515 [Streptomyces sp.]|nr:hypothetical protein [Streptomyces sp.]
MLTENGSAKYLNKDWHRKRAQAMIDRTRFSAEELDWLEIEEHQGRGQLLKESYMVESSPVVSDPFARPKYRRHDVRDRPGAGGSE